MSGIVSLADVGMFFRRKNIRFFALNPLHIERDSDKSTLITMSYITENEIDETLDLPYITCIKLAKITYTEYLISSYGLQFSSFFYIIYET